MDYISVVYFFKNELKDFQNFAVNHKSSCLIITILLVSVLAVATEFKDGFLFFSAILLSSLSTAYITTKQSENSKQEIIYKTKIEYYSKYMDALTRSLISCNINNAHDLFSASVPLLLIADNEVCRICRNLSTTQHEISVLVEKIKKCPPEDHDTHTGLNDKLENLQKTATKLCALIEEEMANDLKKLK